jgi:hypothetical protein
MQWSNGPWPVLNYCWSVRLQMQEQSIRILKVTCLCAEIRVGTFWMRVQSRAAVHNTACPVRCFCRANLMLLSTQKTGFCYHLYASIFRTVNCVPDVTSHRRSEAVSIARVSRCPAVRLLAQWKCQSRPDAQFVQLYHWTKRVSHPFCFHLSTCHLIDVNNTQPLIVCHNLLLLTLGCCFNTCPDLSLSSHAIQVQCCCNPHSCSLTAVLCFILQATAGPLNP